MDSEKSGWCSSCGCLIPAERVEFLLENAGGKSGVPLHMFKLTCVNCSTEGLRHDPNEVCAKASPSGQNGFAPKS